MIFLRIIFGVIAVCQNWFALLSHRILAKLGIGRGIRIDLIKFRNGLAFSTGRRHALGSSDLFLVWEIWYKKCYFLPDRDFGLGQGDTVVDIGANKGYFSIYAASHVFNGVVYSFEPAKDNYDLLVENIKLNRIQNVRAFNLAVTDSNGQMSLYHDPANEGGHSLVNKSAQVETVRTAALADFCRQNQIDKIDFLKIDCEGAEYEILMNLPAESFAKIRRISMEYHRVKNYYPDQLVQVLQNHGFQILQFNELYIKAINPNFK
jgi:FkbM family methyltransferase